MESLKNKVVLHDSNHTYFSKNCYALDLTENALLYTNDEVVRIQRSVPVEMIKACFQILIAGRSVKALNPPITLYTYSSTLHFFLIEFTYLNYFINKVLEVNDPLEKIQQIISYSIASKHLILSNEKPLDPLLGETLQFKADDLIIYTECISTNPMIILFYGVGKKYKISGYFEPRDRTGPISNIIQKGMKLQIVLEDKTKSQYTLSSPEFIINNLITGKRNVNYIGTQEIIDKKNKLYCKTFYNAESKKSIFDKVFTSKRDRFDLVRGFITQKKEIFESDSIEVFKSQELISYYEGNWADFVMIDGVKTWTFDLLEPPELLTQTVLLPSDVTFRSDYKFLQEKNLEMAQASLNMIYDQDAMDQNKRDQYKSSKLLFS